MNIAAIIPARLASTRFPGKLLAPFCGRPILENVVGYARRLDFVNRLVLATDSRELVPVAGELGIECFWCEKARCGTERSFRFFEAHRGFDAYVSIPADEPWIDPGEISRAWREAADGRILEREEIATLFTRFYCREDLESRLSCKIVTDDEGVVCCTTHAASSRERSRESCFRLRSLQKACGGLLLSQDLSSGGTGCPPVGRRRHPAG
jgi:3-deoxy-manno-octulosonate cytidylyltransferase (CMP-KDO synthetase)